MIYSKWHNRMNNWSELLLGQAFVLLGQLGQALRLARPLRRPGPFGSSPPREQDVTVTTDMEFRVNDKVMFELDDYYDRRLGQCVCVKVDGRRFPMRKDRTWNIEGIAAVIVWEVAVTEGRRSDADKRLKAITAHRQMLNRVLNDMGYQSASGKIVLSNTTFDVAPKGVELTLRLDIDDERKLRSWISKLESIGALKVVKANG